MQSTVSAHQLKDAWLDSFEDISILSLDCFDTLFWRKVVHPTDVFTALERTATYQRYHLTAHKRTVAEGRVRERSLLVSGCLEVTLQEIYQEADCDLTQEALDELIQAEVACEIEFGFIFQPIAELIKLARARQMRVIIVSDTYFNASQLRQLLFGTMPALEGMIDHIFCSAEYRKAKATGIWRDVLSTLGVLPRQVVHLGDNYHADLDGPRAFGIAAQHLVSFVPEISDILTQRQQVSAQIFPLGPIPLIAPQFFHGQLSRVESFDAEKFGYASLGPTFYAFANYILAEVESIQSKGRTVKVAYLLRDGYLPGRACEALKGGTIGSYLNISRFTALAASLDSEEAILAALGKVVGTGDYAAALRQLLLPKAQIELILKQLQEQGSAWPGLVRAVTRPAVKAVIFKQSKHFRQRLLAHVVRLTGVKRGDTLMLVDVGYSGTAQLSLHKVLREHLGVELIGRYLVANDLAFDNLDKRGLIDPSWADPRLIASLVRYIAALEMMCTPNQSSTVDYEQDGSPIFEDATTHLAQSERVAEVQRGCIRFIREFVEQVEAFKPTLDAQQLRYTAAIDLIRLLYFPVAAELSCLEGFKFDSNLGTGWLHPLLDIEAGERALRNQGLGYIETTLKHSRANTPMELRHSNLALSALVFAHIRYGFNIDLAKLSLRSEPIEVLLVNGDQLTKDTLIALPTYDGFYAVRIPCSRNFDISLLLGGRYGWVQVESLQLIDPQRPSDAVDLTLNEDVLVDGMQHRGNGLFEISEYGFFCFLRSQESESNLAYSLVFRPLTGR